MSTVTLHRSVVMLPSSLPCYRALGGRRWWRRAHGRNAPRSSSGQQLLRSTRHPVSGQSVVAALDDDGGDAALNLVAARRGDGSGGPRAHLGARRGGTCLSLVPGRVTGTLSPAITSLPALPGHRREVSGTGTHVPGTWNVAPYHVSGDYAPTGNHAAPLHGSVARVRGQAAATTKEPT
jgi:hypothetical protein